MTQLAYALWQIITFRATTSKLPYSYGLLIIAALIDAYLSYQSALISFDSLKATSEVALILPDAQELTVRMSVSCVLKIIFVAGLLHINQTLPRLHKTLVAVFCTEVIFNGLSLGLVYSGGGLLISQLLLLISIWNIMVRAHIIKCAIDTNLGKGFLLALLMMFFEGMPIFFSVSVQG